MPVDPPRPALDRRPVAHRAPARARLAAVATLVAVVLAGCQVAAPPTVSDLRAVAGPLEGYPDALARDLVAVGSGFTYGTGSVVPGSPARVAATLTAVDDLADGALDLPSGPACAELVLDPPDLRIHWQRDLWVYEDDALVGYVARTDTLDVLPQATGDRLYGYVAASTAGRVTGVCDLGDEEVTWDLELLKGWNHVLYVMDDDDPVRRSTVRVEAPDPAFPWRFFLPN